MERDISYPVLNVFNPQSGGVFGDAATFRSANGVNSLTWTQNTTCYQGTAGRFQKYTDDNKYAVIIETPGSSAEGLYVGGTIYTPSPMARGIETSRGTEAIFGVSAPNVDVMDSGRGSLSAGTARVVFDRMFVESVSGPSDLTVTVTPVGGWSGIYIEAIDEDGFDVRSDAGDMGVEFHWVAVGRARGHEERPVITAFDSEESRRFAREKAAEIEATRPPRREPPREVTITAP